MYAVFLIFMFVTISTMLVTGFRSVNARLSGRFLSMVAVGDMAPDFELKSYSGKTFKLSSYRGKKPVVVFFYPADNTPGCTTEVRWPMRTDAPI
jgi:peroxiredoxin